MRQSVVFFLLAIVACTIAYNSDAQFIKSLKTQKFGNSILESIQIELSNGGNQVDNILKFLKQLKTENIAEQKAAKIANNKTQTIAAAQVKALTARINTLTQAIKTDKALSASLKVEITGLQTQVKNKKDEKDAEEILLAENRQIQIDTKKDYETKSTAISAQITGLAEANEQIQNLKSQNSENTNFIEMASSAQQSIFNIKFQHPKFQGLLNVLAQLMSSEIIADQKLVDFVMKIIEDLTGQLRTEQEILTQWYKNKRASLKNKESNLIISISTIVSEIARLEQSIATKKMNIVMADARVVNNSNEKLTKTSERTDTIKSAKDAQTKYDKETQRRTEELVIINKVIVIFETRFTDDVKAAVETTD